MEASTRRTGFVYDEIYLEHDTGHGHVERPDRLSFCLRALKQSGFWNQLHHIEATPATLDQLCYVHKCDHIDRVKSHCQREIPLDYDTPVSKQSFDIALLAAGGVLRAVDRVIAGDVDNAFALVRPPGHHATPNRAMGFCLFNNIAIASRYLQSEYGLNKIAVVDWDVHHGNGTQDTFYADPSVFFFSIHQHPLYPGSGLAHETGLEKADGTTLNCPVPAHSDINDYIHIFKERLAPELIEFNPDFMLISSGFDAHQLDPLSTINITSEGFGDLTEILLSIADQVCEGYVVSVLEGGYDLSGLSESVVAHVKRLINYNTL